MRRTFLSILAALLIVTGLGYSAWRLVTQKSSQSCRACLRPVHSHSRTVAVVDGKRGVYCCPACALSEHQQSAKPVSVLELTDHLGSGALKPEECYVVRDSDVNLCLGHRPALDQDKQPMYSRFDRCSPSILSFRGKGSAESFAKAHGGRILSFAELAAEYRR